MIDKKLIEKIKKACEIISPELKKAWDDNIITDESVSNSYNRICGGQQINESITDDNAESFALSNAAIACYKMAVKNGKI